MARHQLLDCLIGCLLFALSLPEAEQLECIKLVGAAPTGPQADEEMRGYQHNYYLKAAAYARGALGISANTMVRALDDARNTLRYTTAAGP